MPEACTDHEQDVDIMADDWLPGAGGHHAEKKSVADSANEETQIVKKITSSRGAKTKDKKSVAKHRYGNLASAVRKDTPIAKEFVRGSAARALHGRGLHAHGQAMHLRSFEWTSRLARQQNVCVRSALRGMALGNQCEEMLLGEFTQGAYTMAGRPRVPVGLHFMAVVAFSFVLREIELSTTLLSSVVIDSTALVVSILLPATKADPGARSCARSWGRACTDPDKADAFACPLPRRLRTEGPSLRDV